ncbi:cytochrome P450 [Mycena rebaudengoi]|nr:cytochrome P450 [Mycena rebaudengoi]
MLSLLFSALLACLVLAVFTAAKFIISLVSAQRYLRHVPGPSSTSFLWGQEWNLYHNPPGSDYYEWHRHFGKVLKFRSACGSQVLSITDPTAVSFVVGEATYSFPKADGVRVWFQKTVGEGILWVEGKAAHEKQRRSLAPAFAHQSIRNFTSIFYDTSTKLAAKWTAMLDQSQSDAIEIEVTNWAGRFALDTVGRAAFSYDFNLLSGEPNALAEALDGLTNNEHKSSSFYMRALFWICPSILSIGKKGEMIRRTKSELGAIARRMWKDAKAAKDSHSTESSKTVMALMLDDDTDHDMHEEEVVAQMRTILSAGYETVSAVVAWVLYELAVHPKIQGELREEISAPGDPSLEELDHKFPFLNSVVLEVLRLHPALLENHHQAAETINIPLSEPIPGTSISQLVIPKNQLVVIPVNVLQMDEGIWGEDAHMFSPARWLGDQKDKRARLFAFSEGPRACIGRRFALGEIKALTVTLIRQFSFSCPYEIEAFQSFVVRPRIKGQTTSSLPLVVRRL